MLQTESEDDEATESQDASFVAARPSSAFVFSFINLMVPDQQGPQAKIQRRLPRKSSRLTHCSFL